MKKQLFKVLSLIITVFLIFSLVFSTECFAATKKGPVIDVTVSPIEDTDYVNVDISFTENPGIGAMTFTLLYDNTTFSASPYNVRYFYSVIDTNLKKYLIVNHPNESYVSIVWSPEGNDNLYTGTGVAFRLTFRIDKQVAGKHPFEIGNIQPITRGKDLSGCFSDFEHNTFTPVANIDAFVIGGDNNIPASYPWKDKETQKPTEPSPSESEHTHKFVLHKKVEPSCLAEGYSVYECSVCGEKEIKDKTAALGHSFNDYWTVDRAATDSVAMKLSRHCSRCDAVTDIYYSTLDNAKELGIENKPGAEVHENSDKGIVKNPTDNEPANETENDKTTSGNSNNNNKKVKANGSDTGNSKSENSQADGNDDNDDNDVGGKTTDNSKVAGKNTKNSKSGGAKVVNGKKTEEENNENLMTQEELEEQVEGELGINPETIESAEQIIEAAKEKAESKTTTGKVKKAYGFFESLYMYLFGTESQPGILRIIFSAIAKFFKSIF